MVKAEKKNEENKEARREYGDEGMGDPYGEEGFGDYGDYGLEDFDDFMGMD